MAAPPPPPPQKKVAPPLPTKVFDNRNSATFGQAGKGNMVTGTCTVITLNPLRIGRLCKNAHHTWSLTIFCLCHFSLVYCSVLRVCMLLENVTAYAYARNNVQCPNRCNWIVGAAQDWSVDGEEKLTLTVDCLEATFLSWSLVPRAIVPLFVSFFQYSVTLLLLLLLLRYCCRNVHRQCQVDRPQVHI